MMSDFQRRSICKSELCVLRWCLFPMFSDKLLLSALFCGHNGTAITLSVSALWGAFCFGEAMAGSGASLI